MAKAIGAIAGALLVGVGFFTAQPELMMIGVSLILSTVLAMAAAALAPKPKTGASAGLLTNYAGTECSLVTVYGQMRVGGMETIPPITSNTPGGAPDGAFLNKVLTIAGHPCVALQNLYANNTLV